jgi:hypothetical protein
LGVIGRSADRDPAASIEVDGDGDGEVRDDVTGPHRASAVGSAGRAERGERRVRDLIDQQPVDVHRDGPGLASVGRPNEAPLLQAVADCLDAVEPVDQRPVR